MKEQQQTSAAATLRPRLAEKRTRRVKNRAVIDEHNPPTRADYDAATPRGKGFLEYTYSEWPGSEVPKGCPFEPGTKEQAEFLSGQDAAMLAAQDSDE
jgi:hypothetical protein